ncbi:gamma-aminobutyric acid receptor alpha-like isoform X2 [Bactrocera neohumeralis]|uniref:gamma-aminobutyric acid receptor alpha-like isoform X2 n=1 Tax=Bactrocera tryoni TaxID=59916 RepID=UPI001A993E0B|nr:gamma-aminobutyric acid receptor alpha-like isoform X2 [Bactrocera tryoni]XP_050333049.1 gamma-aminobutyric acid receptor alpha-like isoform X2 [Bactrocera neohumeralis]
MHSAPTTPSMPSATSSRGHHSTIGLLSSLMRRLLKLLISCLLMPAMQHHIHVNWSPMSTSPTSSILAHASTISLSLSLSATNSTSVSSVTAPTAKLDVGMAAVAAAALSGLGARAPASWSVAASHMRLTQRNNHANISELLDNLLRGYDNSIRPGFGGPPATVEVDIMVRSMGPISEVDMTYSMDCYFRQSWVDKRLAFKGAQDTLALSVSMLARIWKPDTYFYNGKQSYLHTITTPNKFVRIYQNGRVLYSSRLTIKAGCPMNLEDFPMDIQKCPLKFGSFGYTTADVVYRWNRERPAVAIAEDMKLSQFDLVDCPAGNLTDVIYKAAAPHDATHNSHKPGNANRNSNNYYNKNAGNDYNPNRKSQKYGGKSMTTFAGPGAKNQHVRAEYSMLMVNFHLQRHMGNFLIQVYGPCCLLVVLSWVSFWLNREATADRVSLGITTVLTMTFLGLEARTDLPKVPYLTALDFFVFLSFAFIFATILQFAVVHYFTKYGSGECYFIIEEMDSDTESEADARTLKSEFNVSTESKLYEVIPLSMCSIPIHSTGKGSTSASSSGIGVGVGARARRNSGTKRRILGGGGRVESSTGGSRYYLNCFTWSCFRRRKRGRVGFDMSDEDDEEAHLRAGEEPTPHRGSGKRRMSFYRREELEARRKGKRVPQYNSVSKIDRASRIVFPMLFLLINVFYWYGYLSRSSRILANTPSAT